MMVRRLSLLVALALAVSGCSTVRDVLGIPSPGDPSVAIRPAETRWVLIKNPRFGDVPSEPEYVWVEEDKIPFTTKGVLLGHVDVQYMRYQVLDTPGLLDRSMEKRNPMERQAIAALSHLADVVVFLLDPTETCGYDVAAQERLLAEIQMRFPEVPILVVENKSDLLKSVSDRRKISALSGAGVRRVFSDAVQLTTSRVPGAARPRESG